jgi:hypothetical protein
MNNVFILGYNAVDYFCEWYKHEENPNTVMRFVDNGQQKIPDYIKNNLIYTTNTKICCSAGWNLICDIAFNTMGLDKIIIGEEDARFSEEILDEITLQTSPIVLCGTYNNSFEFSLYGIHKDTWNKVGKFDENFVFAGCEDNDYKHRCMLNDVNVISLGVSHYFNGNSSTSPTSPIPTETRMYNEEYLKNKWGNYVYKYPFNDPNHTCNMTPMFKKYYGDLAEWPSITEFKMYENTLHNI